MLIVTYDHLRVEKPVEDEIKVECFSEAFTEKFSSETVKSTPESLNSDTCNQDLDNELDDELDDDNEELTILFCVLAAKPGRGVARVLLVNPVYHGWRRSLRIIGYVQAWSKKYLQKTHNGVKKDCRICMLGEDLWNPRNEEKEAREYFFR